MKNFIQYLKKIFIGEQKPLPAPFSTYKAPPAIPAPAPKELSCLAKGIINSLNIDNDSWAVSDNNRAFLHKETKIFLCEKQSDRGSCLTVQPESIESQLSYNDTHMILNALRKKRDRALDQKEQKRKKDAAKEVEVITEFFNKLGCS